MLEGLKLPKKAVAVHWDRRKDALRQFQESGRLCLLGTQECTASYKCPLKTFL